MANFILIVLCCFLSFGIKADTGHAEKNRLRMIVSGGDLRPYAHIVRENHEEYARFRKLKYLYFKHAHYKDSLRWLKPNWIKIVALISALNDSEVPENSWVAWVDDDAVIDDFEHSLSIFDRYIQAYASDRIVEVIATEDCNKDIRFNTGVLLLRKNNLSRNLVNTWWERRPAPDFSIKDQAVLIDEVRAQDLELKGLFRVVPQREGDLNLNTFTDGYNDEKCSARSGDFVTQPAGSHDKAGLIFSRIADIQSRHPFPFGTRAYFYYGFVAHYVSTMRVFDLHPRSVPKMSLRGAKEFVVETLSSEEFHSALPVISVLTVVSFVVLFYMAQ